MKKKIINRGDMDGLEFDLKVLSTPDLENGVYKAAIEGVYQKAFTSSLYILTTEGVEGSKEVYDMTTNLMYRICDILAEFILKSHPGLTCTGYALSLKNFIETVVAAARELNDYTANQPPGKEQKNGIAIRSAFVHFPGHGHCTEKDYQLPIECGGCGVVIKEFRGYQLRLVPRLITRWIEPWFSRRRLIQRIVWVLEWIPAEYIKTITVDCCGDKKKTRVQQQLVLDKGLMTFWKCH